MEEDNTNYNLNTASLLGKKFCITGSFEGYSRHILIEK